MKSDDLHTYIKNSQNKTDEICISFIDTKERPNNIVLSDPKGNTERILTDKTDGITIEKSNSNDTEIIIKNTYKIKNLVIFCKMKTPYVTLFVKSKYPLIVNYNIEDFSYLVLIIPPQESEVDKIANGDIDDDIPDDSKSSLCIEEEEDDEDDEEEDEEYV
jgi:hypothetical protein